MRTAVVCSTVTSRHITLPALSRMGVTFAAPSPHPGTIYAFRQAQLPAAPVP